MCFQTAVCRQGLAPKQITTPEFTGLANYAYHLDAGKFVPFLQRRTVSRNSVLVTCMTRSCDIEPAETGDIIACSATESGEIRSRVIYSSIAAGFQRSLDRRSISACRFCRKRMCCSSDQGMGSASSVSDSMSRGSTSVTRGHRAVVGWVWDIGLTSRRGVGYVYSSGYVSDDGGARGAQRNYLQRPRRLGRGDLSFRKIDINSAATGKEFWTRNCVAVGLSAGIHRTSRGLGHCHDRTVSQIDCQSAAELTATACTHAARIFNDTFRYRWERIVDFLKLHYVLEPAAPTPHSGSRIEPPESIPDSLRPLPGVLAGPLPVA